MDFIISASLAGGTIFSSNSIKAVSVAKLTVADLTPGVFDKASSITATHEAQCMPRILYVCFVILFVF